MADQPVSAVILAAGLGTRMNSGLAKVLHRAGGACLLEHVLRASRSIAPPESTTAVIGHQAERIRAMAERYGIRFQIQSEPRGTGHALLSCAAVPGIAEGRVVVLYGDCPLISAATLRRLMEQHASSGAAATVITTHLQDPTGYGRIVRGAGGRVEGIVEEKAASAEQKRITEINSGIYCFEARLLWAHLAEVQANPASGEIYLTDVVERLNASGHATMPLPTEDPNEILGINTRIELAYVDRIFRERKTRELMLAGVTIEKPETVTIDLDVEVGRDTLIGPFVQLLGATKLGEECVVEACSIVENSELARGAKVHAFSSIVDSRLDECAEAGPYARLRMGAEAGPGAHIGNFVELKKTRLGAGSKAMHLAYLGDSSIGERVNIGAGAITCNYDGRKKHATTIGDDAFVGSNSTLVAPVEVGAGSYVAAGSVITHQVPADALGIGRSRQMNKEQWARARREKNQQS